MGKSIGKNGKLTLDARSDQSASSDATSSAGYETYSSAVTTQSGGVVIAAATSGGGNVSKVYKHWADGDAPLTAGEAEWQGNILQDGKSDYFEGEVIPHVFVYTASSKTPLVNGQTYSFNITYNYYQANTNAGGFAFITDYDANRDPGLVPGLSQIEPTEDGTFTNGGGIQGSFYTVDANITNVSDVTYTGSGTMDGHVTVTFVYTGTTTTSGFAEIYYGLYIAEPGQVPDQGSGTTDGANAWTGGSLQTTVDIGGSGATSLQLSPNAIIAGEISGMKFSDVNGDGTRDADGADNIAGNADDEVGLAGWTIFLDTDNDGILDAGETSTVTGADGTYSFSVTPDADKTDGQADNDPYLVREVQQAGWTQTTANPAPILITSDDPTETGVNFGNQPPIPDIDIVKSVVGNPIIDSVGDVIDFTVDVSNPGNVALSGVVVTDEIEDTTNPGGTKSLTVTELTAGGFNTGDTDQDDLLDPGEIWHYTVSYTITQDDFDNGVLGDGVEGLTNVATVDSDQTEPESDDAVVTPLFAQFPEITLLKDGEFTDDDGDGIDEATDGDGIAQVGELITYTFTITNTGNVTLTGVTVTDPLIDVNGSPIASMAPGDVDSTTYTGTYAITQEDIDAGNFYNLATVTGADPDSNPVSDTDDHDEPLPQAKALHIEKDADLTVVDSTSDIITYTMLVTNVGNSAIANVQVDDPFLDDEAPVLDAGFNVGDTDQDNLLDVDETWEFTGTHQVTQAELDAGGSIENTATATGDDAEPDDDDADVPVDQNKILHIEKDADLTIVDSTSDIITYTMLVTNIGNAAIANVDVDDPLLDDEAPVLDGGFNAGDTDQDNLLDVDETWQFTGTYQVTQDDLDAGGSIDNTATATGDDAEPDDDDADVPVDQNPSIDLVKKVNGSDANTAPGPILVGTDPLFTFEVTNDGNITLHNVVLMDDNGTPGDSGDDFEVTLTGLTDEDGDGDADDLAVGATATGSFTGELQTGQQTNTATVTSTEASDTDPANYLGYVPVEVTGNPQFNFPNDVDKIQPKLQGGSFTLNSNGFIFWDMYTSDTDLAQIDLDPATYESLYPGLTVSIVKIWENGDDAIYRIYVANETDSAISLTNNTNIVEYDVVQGDGTPVLSTNKGLIDLINSDPLIGNFNNFNNIENALTKDTENGFLTNPLSFTAGADKVWASPNEAGTDMDESPVTYDTGAGNDAVYGRNNTDATSDSLSGGDGNDMLDGRAGGDTLNGGAGDDQLFGSVGDDTLNGGSGNDILFGSYGTDTLTGGDGADIFIVRYGDYDIITDFDTTEGDQIWFWRETLDDTGATASIADVTYNSVTGELSAIGSFDPNIAIPFAQLDAGLTLTIGTNVNTADVFVT